MIWAIIITGLILRLISLDQNLWLDEAINIQASKNYSLFDLVTQYAKADFHPPGYFIIIWLWTKLAGYSEIAVRLPSVSFGLLTIWTTYLIGKNLVSKKLGLLAGLLIAINPLHIYYSQEARMYAMAALVVSVNILLLIKLIKGEKLNLFFLLISDLAILASDYIAYFIFPAQFALLMIIGKKVIIKKWIMMLLTALLLGIWWLPVFLGQLNVGSIASSNLPTWKFVAGAFDFKTIPLTFVKFIIGRISLADKLIYYTILLPLCGFFIYLIWKGVKAAGEFEKKLLLAWIIIPVGLATIISLWVPVYNYFRVLYVLPSFVILISLGILSAKLRLRYMFLTATVLIALFCSLVYLLNPSYQREDWKGLVSFFNTDIVEQNRQAVILFESSGTLPPFDYYANGKLNAKGGLRDFPARKESDVVDLSNFGKDIYLVDYLVEISDPNRLIAKRLMELGYKQGDIKNFNGVGFVYHYIKYD